MRTRCFLGCVEGAVHTTRCFVRACAVQHGTFIVCVCNCTLVCTTAIAALPKVGGEKKWWKKKTSTSLVYIKQTATLHSRQHLLVTLVQLMLDLIRCKHGPMLNCTPTSSGMESHVIVRGCAGIATLRTKHELLHMRCTGSMSSKPQGMADTSVEGLLSVRCGYFYAEQRVPHTLPSRRIPPDGLHTRTAPGACHTLSIPTQLADTCCLQIIVCMPRHCSDTPVPGLPACATHTPSCDGAAYTKVCAGTMWCCACVCTCYLSHTWCGPLHRSVVTCNDMGRFPSEHQQCLHLTTPPSKVCKICKIHTMR